MVRDLLDKYGDPPDFSSFAIERVIKQAESLTEEWLSENALQPCQELGTDHKVWILH